MPKALLKGGTLTDGVLTGPGVPAAHAAPAPKTPLITTAKTTVAPIRRRLMGVKARSAAMLCPPLLSGDSAHRALNPRTPLHPLGLTLGGMSRALHMTHAAVGFSRYL